MFVMSLVMGIKGILHGLFSFKNKRKKNSNELTLEV